MSTKYFAMNINLEHTAVAQTSSSQTSFEYCTLFKVYYSNEPKRTKEHKSKPEKFSWFI